MARKRIEETRLKAQISKDPERQRLYGSVWKGLSDIAIESKALYPKLSVLENAPTTFGSILPIARHVYRLAKERQKPNGDRLREYSEAGLPSLEDSLFSPAPLTPGLERAILAEYLSFALRVLGSTHPPLRAILDGRSPEQVAIEAIEGTKLFDLEERKRLAASADLVEASTDPLLRIVRLLEPEARRVRKEYEDRVQSPQSIETARLAQAQYSLGGNIYPDATFTLRVSFGPVSGYKDKTGKPVSWMTDFAGLYRRNTGVEPYSLPKRWMDARPLLKLSTPFNFVTTADTHGGNSGSPTVNTKGEIVGILFDGNLEGLPNRYLYTEDRARSVHVASQGIVEALRKVYGAQALLKELGQ